MRLKEKIEDAQKTHDIAHILGAKKKLIVCPLPGHIHSDNTPSFSIFWKDGVQYFRCHGNCGLIGDVIDLAGYMNITGYNRKDKGMVQRALEYIDRKYEIYIPIPVKQVKLAGSEWYDYLPIGEEGLEYAKGRGLTYKTIMKFRVGQSGKFITMPCFKEGRLIGIKMRRIVAGEPRFYALPGSRQGLFNVDSIAYTDGPVFIVKGEIPCMLLDQMGFLSCAPTGGEGGWDESWRSALAFSQNIVIGDNDAPGRKLGEKRALILGAKLVFPPEGVKDIDAWILKDPDHAINQLIEWSSYEAK